MSNLTRRQILLGGSAVAAASLIPAVPKTPLTPQMRMMAQAVATDISRPDYIIRLSSNENPYGPSRVALQAIDANMHRTNRYNMQGERSLAEVIARINGLTSDHLMIGSGSGEILNIAGMLAGMSGGSVVCIDPTFQALLRYAHSAGAEIIRVPVNEAMAADLDGMRRAIRPDTNLVYLVNPNNPIPNIINGKEMRDFVLEMSESRLVFVDEAYHEYVEDPNYSSMLELVANGHKNIVVARTASKIHGLAGLRIGFGYAHPDLIKDMQWRKTGDTTVLSIEAAMASYQDDEFQNFSRRKNRESRAIVEDMCERYSLRYIKSNTNFSLIETGIENQQFQSTMLKHGIATGRDFPPINKTWSRISMSKPEEMEYFVQIYARLFT
ncbi:MAG: hypothetical protein CMO98_13115 [Woeseia sp.]|nr:hypothetical protein [Woeseia sp.]|tara:strand:+ start:4931 stop:6076 length:1146 start_codon:yes stop_codon:yes gene_type:complete